MAKSEDHLTPEICEALLAGRIPPKKLPKHLPDHLFALCPQCLAVLRGFSLEHQGGKGRKATPEEEARIDQAFRGILTSASTLWERIRRERSEVGKILAGLTKLPSHAARVECVRKSSRFRSWTLCERLLAKSQGLSLEHPQNALEAATLALETARALDGTEISKALINDLLARGWALTAHAQRLAGRPQQAHKTFTKARSLLAKGSGDPLVEAEIVGLAALNHRDLQQLAQAAQLHDRCVDLYELYEMAPQLAQAKLLRAATHLAGEEAHEAIEDLRAVLEGAEGNNERLRLCAEQLLVLSLFRAGRAEEAEERLAELRSGNPKLDRWSRMRDQLLEAELAGSARSEPTSAREWGLLADSGVFHPGMAPTQALFSQMAGQRASL